MIIELTEEELLQAVRLWAKDVLPTLEVTGVRSTLRSAFKARPIETKPVEPQHEEPKVVISGEEMASFFFPAPPPGELPTLENLHPDWIETQPAEGDAPSAGARPPQAADCKPTDSSAASEAQAGAEIPTAEVGTIPDGFTLTPSGILTPEIPAEAGFPPVAQAEQEVPADAPAHEPPAPCDAPRETGAGVLSQEPDWDALVDLVFSGRSLKEVATEAGVDPMKLGGKYSGKLRSQRLAATRACAAADAGEGARSPAAPSPNDQTVENVQNEQICKSAKPAQNIPENIPAPSPSARAKIDEGALRAASPLVDHLIREIDADEAKATTTNGAVQWSAERDLALAEGVIRKGFVHTAKALGLDEKVIAARWHHLLPVKGLTQQGKLLARLRREAGQ